MTHNILDNAEISSVNIGTLKPYKNNARKHPDKQIQQIANSIKQFGFMNPVLVDAENMIMAGHGRVEAANLAYKIQEKAYGSLSKTIRNKFRRLAFGNQQMLVPKFTVAPGTKLVRSWKSKKYTVTVLEKGYEYEGKVYRSLTPIVEVITGYRSSGPYFFGLTNHDVLFRGRLFDASGNRYITHYSTKKNKRTFYYTNKKEKKNISIVEFNATIKNVLSSVDMDKVTFRIGSISKIEILSRYAGDFENICDEAIDKVIIDSGRVVVNSLKIRTGKLQGNNNYNDKITVLFTSLETPFNNASI